MLGEIMIKLININSRNIGDRLSSRLLAGYISTFTGHDVIPADYGVYSDDQLNILLDSARSLVVGTGAMFGSYNTAPLFDADYGKIDIPIIIWSSGLSFGMDIDGHTVDFYSKMIELFSRSLLIGMRTPYERDTISLLCNPNKCYISPDPMMFSGYNSISGNTIGISFNGYVNNYICNIMNCSTNISGKECIPIIHDEEYLLYSNYNEFSMSMYRDADVIVTNRFHGAVLAVAYGKPFFMIDSNSRTRSILDMFYDNEDGRCNLYHMDEFRDRFEKFYCNRNYYRDMIIEKRESYRRDFIDFGLMVGDIL